MIKRIMYDREGNINVFLPTSMTTEFVSDDLQLYCDCNGTESTLSEIPSLKGLLIQKHTEQINKKTEELINYGIVYRDVRFWCTQEAQQNFTGLYIQKDAPIITYPYTIWDGENAVDIVDSQEMETFCLLVMEHVQTQKIRGKRLRSDLSLLTEVELLHYTDPRL